MWLPGRECGCQVEGVVVRQRVWLAVRSLTDGHLYVTTQVVH